MEFSPSWRTAAMPLLSPLVDIDVRITYTSLSKSIDFTGSAMESHGFDPYCPVTDPSGCAVTINSAPGTMNSILVGLGSAALSGMLVRKVRTASSLSDFEFCSK